jgi:hypothetical protein
MSINEIQLSVRIQHFYDYMQNRRHNKDAPLNPSRVLVENEIDAMMNEFSKVFGDIIYK